MDKKSVQIQMVKPTFDKINKIGNLMNTKSKSDVIKISVDIAHILVKEIKNQSTVIIEDKDGNRTQLIIPEHD